MKYVVECFETQCTEEDGNFFAQDVLHNVFIIDDLPEVCQKIGEDYMKKLFQLDELDKTVHRITVTPLGEYCDNLLKIGKEIRTNVENNY